MKKLLLILPLLVCGCLATENRKIPMNCRGVAAVDSSGVAVDSSSTTVFWWRTPYYAADKYKSPWDKFVPAPVQDPLDLELEYFRHNVIKWPKTMPRAYVPERSTPKDPPRLKPEPAGEVY